MKFKGTISKIDSEGVKGKEDNHWGGPPTWENVLCSLEQWLHTEANRREYDIASSTEWFCLACDRFLESHEINYEEECGTCGNLTDRFPEIIQVGDRIEGEIINDQIVNVKICQ